MLAERLRDAGERSLSPSSQAGGVFVTPMRIWIIGPLTWAIDSWNPTSSLSLKPSKGKTNYHSLFIIATEKCHRDVLQGKFSSAGAGIRPHFFLLPKPMGWKQA